MKHLATCVALATVTSSQLLAQPGSGTLGSGSAESVLAEINQANVADMLHEFERNESDRHRLGLPGLDKPQIVRLYPHNLTLTLDNWAEPFDRSGRKPTSVLLREILLNVQDPSRAIQDPNAGFYYTTNPSLPKAENHTDLPQIRAAMLAFKGRPFEVVTYKEGELPSCAAIANAPYATGPSIKGTAFYVGNHGKRAWFATARHVLKRSGTKPHLVITNPLSMDALASFPIILDRTIESEMLDIALFKVRRMDARRGPSTYFHQLQHASTPAPANSPVSLLGYPNGNKNLCRINNSYVAKIDETFTRISPNHLGDTLVSGNVWQGNSGGPVLNSENQIIGLVRAYPQKPGASGDYDPSEKRPTEVSVSLENCYGVISIGRVMELLPK